MGRSLKVIATLNPVSRLEANTEYTAVLEGAGDGDNRSVKYQNGDKLERDYVWHFRIGGD